MEAGMVRFAQYEDLERVNDLRKQVNDLHVSGRPDVFKPGFPEELQNYVYSIFRDPLKKIVVCEKDGMISGFAVLNHITRPETPFMLERDYLDIDEFASAMIRFIADYAKREGFDRIELNMWEFNRSALEFYEAVGFTTYRRYMELEL